jgi:hypothetical protein
MKRRALGACCVLVATITTITWTERARADDEADETARGADDDWDSGDDEPGDDLDETEPDDDLDEAEPNDDDDDDDDDGTLAHRAPSDEPGAAPPSRRFWLGIAGTLELALFPPGDDLCRLAPNGDPQNDVGVYCTNPDGTDLPSRQSPEQNVALIPGLAGRSNGGIAASDVRVLLTADYAVTQAVLAGLRLGYVFNAYPGNAAPGGYPWTIRNLHTELRVTYLFGKAPLVGTGFSPLAFVAGGASQFDAHAKGFVSLHGVAGERVVNVWVIGGPWFAGLGGGTRYRFSARAAFTAALRFNVAFPDPTFLVTAGPEVGFAYGF